MGRAIIEYKLGREMERYYVPPWITFSDLVQCRREFQKEQSKNKKKLGYLPRTNAQVWIDKNRPEWSRRAMDFDKIMLSYALCTGSRYLKLLEQPKPKNAAIAIPGTGLADGTGNHRYPGSEAMKKSGNMSDFFTSDCEYGCGCWMGSSRSGGPDGVDQFGKCPKAPLNVGLVQKSNG